METVGQLPIASLLSLHKKRKFSMWSNLRETVDLVTFTEEILNGKLLWNMYGWAFSQIFDRVLREKCSCSELFWFAFSRIRTEYGEILRTLRIRSKWGKIQTRTFPNTDTFCAVKYSSVTAGVNHIQKIHLMSLLSTLNMYLLAVKTWTVFIASSHGHHQEHV